MSYIKEKVAYLRGLTDGLDIADDSQGKLLKAIVATLDEMADAVEENQAALADLDESVEDIYGQLDEIDDCLFDDDDDDDEPFDEDSFFEVECPSCGETIYFDTGMLDEDGDLLCPNCNAPVLPDPPKDEE